MSTQALTLTLDGITAGDYLSWVRDPEPPALGRELRSVTVQADTLGNSVDVELEWNGEPPSARAAASAGGLPPIPEVIEVQRREPTGRRELAHRTRRRMHPAVDPASAPSSRRRSALQR